MTMLAMMEFIDNLSLEDRLYWQISRGDTGAVIELLWERTVEGSRWSVKPGHNGSSETSKRVYTYDRHGAAAHLAAIDVDCDALTRQLGASIMTQALYADLMLDGAKKLFGETALSQGLGNVRRFMKNVTDKVAASKPSRPRLSLVSGLNQGKQ